MEVLLWWYVRIIMSKFFLLVLFYLASFLCGSTEPANNIDLSRVEQDTTDGQKQACKEICKVMREEHDDKSLKRIPNLEIKITDLEKQINNLKSAIDNLKSEIDNNSEQLNRLQLQLTAKKKEISDDREAVAALSKRLKKECDGCISTSWIPAGL